MTQPPESQSLSLAHGRRAHTPCKQEALLGQAEAPWHGSGSQRCAAPQVVSALGHGASALQPGAQAPPLQMPVAQSASEAQAKHFVTVPDTPQWGLALGQSVSAKHSRHWRNGCKKPTGSEPHTGAPA